MLVAQSGRHVRPYAKWFKLQYGVYFYKTVYGAKRNCPIVFNWRVPPNAVSSRYNLRGVVYSRKAGALSRLLAGIVWHRVCKRLNTRRECSTKCSRI